MCEELVGLYKDIKRGGGSYDKKLNVLRRGVSPLSWTRAQTVGHHPRHDTSSSTGSLQSRSAKQ